jgi:hypothetical protein
MTMATPGWKPLPECPGCERPVKAAVAKRNGGYCTMCRPLGPSPVQALGGVDLAEWQRLVADRGARQRAEAAQRAAKRRRRG